MSINLRDQYIKPEITPNDIFDAYKLLLSYEFDPTLIIPSEDYQDILNTPADMINIPLRGQSKLIKIVDDNDYTT